MIGLFKPNLDAPKSTTFAQSGAIYTSTQMLEDRYNGLRFFHLKMNSKMKRISFLMLTALLLGPLSVLQSAEPSKVLLAGMASKKQPERIEAIRGLGQCGVEAIPALEHVFLDDGGWSHAAMMREERLLALESLARINSPECVPVLVLAAGDWDNAVRKEAQRQLVVFGVKLDDLRRHWLLTEDWFLRQGAMITLMDHGIATDDLAREIAALLKDKAGKQRLAAVQALGQLESREGIPSLKALLADESTDQTLRLEALGALHHIDGREVPLQAWTLALGEQGMRTLYLATLSGVHIAMRYLEGAGAKAVPVLCDALTSRDPQVRTRSAWVLGRIGPAAIAALPALRMAASDPEWYVADEARRALAKVQPDKAPLKLSIPQETASASSVKIEDRAQTFFLDNGLISCEVNKVTGNLVSLHRAGDSRNVYAEKQQWYATYPWTLPRGMGRPKPIRCEARVLRQSEDLVEVVITSQLELPRPITQEQHYVLRRGVSGIYQFAVFRKPAETQAHPENVFDYCRFMSVDPGIFRYGAVSDSLQGRLFCPEEIAKWHLRKSELSNATDRLPNGRIWAKYSWCSYEQETQLHGVTGDKLGLWVILPNDESGYNLPSNHPGTVQDGIIIVTHQEGVPHSIGSEQRVNIGTAPWEKLYGPILLYVNSGASHAEMWADAKRRAELEAAAHPAAWMQNDLYPLERGGIRGRVLTAEGKPAAGAWVILCHPNPNPDYAWQRHIGPYIYRAFAAHDGTFEISGVRAGSYSLFARLDGTMGVARTDDITLEKNQQRDAGVLTIQEKPHGKLLWEIGSPDGTPREFLGSLDSHEWCGWLNNYRRFFPKDVDFTVGKSDPARDWYYCQPGGWPDGYSSTAKPTQWRIHFDLPKVPTNGALFTVCIAATRGGALSVQCNDTKLPVRQLIESDPRTSLCMCPDRGAYYGFRTERIEIDPSQLHVGRNTLTLQFASGRQPGEAIMYDYLKLEAR